MPMFLAAYAHSRPHFPQRPQRSTVYGPAISSAQRSAAHVRVICVLPSWVAGPHAGGGNALGLGDAATRDFNDRLRSFCEERGAEAFDTRAVAHDMSIASGVHRGLAANVLLAQLFLNLLSQGHGWVDALGDSALL